MEMSALAEMERTRFVGAFGNDNDATALLCCEVDDALDGFCLDKVRGTDDAVVSEIILWPELAELGHTIVEEPRIDLCAIFAASTRTAAVRVEAAKMDEKERRQRTVSIRMDRVMA